ncbi:MAG: DUF4388 domain-containing protein [Deltaproteobacteria bacterium]|nr:DUF4388 domain-containing protein [Deltaproteobacteria bacterium]
MALKGTLKDFGIADIFQLISHQSKTGVLHLHSKEQEVRISFVNGDVVRAESTTRKQKDLLGAMFVRAEVISDAQLEQALEIQKRTLKRLGNILVERGFIAQADLKEFTLLQTTETVYKLFNWETGTYAFEAEEVVYDKDTVDPIRSENVLMEGFRMVDEWPMVRKKVSSFDTTYKKVKELPGGSSPQSVEDEIDNALDDMFAEGESSSEKGKGVGRNENKVYGLIEPDRTVQKLIDLSRLGEFETCKALHSLLSDGYIKGETVVRKDALEEKPGKRVRSIAIGRMLVQAGMYLFIIGRMLVQAGMYLFIIGLLFILYRTVDVFAIIEDSESRIFQNPIAKELVGSSHLSKIQNALEVYRLENGQYPEDLEELVKAGMLNKTSLSFPWHNPRVYQRRDLGYILMRPFE